MCSELKKIGVLLIAAMLFAAPGGGMTEGGRDVFSICANGKHISNEEKVLIREAKGNQKGIIGSRCAICGRMVSLTFYTEEAKRLLK